MRYIDGTKQELLVSTPQFPALILAHDRYDAARFHWHPGFELLYAKDCSIAVSLMDSMVLIHPGQLYAILPAMLHAVRMVSDGAASTSPQSLSITINPAEMAATFPDIMQAQRLIDYGLFNRQGDTVSAELCERLYRSLVSHNPTRYLSANADFFALMTRLFDVFGRMDELRPSSDGDAQTIGSVYRYIQNCFLGPVTTTEVAKHFGYSREYFSRFFKRYAGVSFMGYVTEMRLNVACEKLRLTDASIRDVARMAGFPSEKSLMNAFVRKFNRTPEQWRLAERSGRGSEQWMAVEEVTH